MTTDRISAEHHAAAHRMAERGYRVIIDYARGGFRVRNPDMTRPPFADENGFVSLKRAKLQFPGDRRLS